MSEILLACITEHGRRCHGCDRLNREGVERDERTRQIEKDMLPLREGSSR